MTISFQGPVLHFILPILKILKIFPQAFPTEMKHRTPIKKKRVSKKRKRSSLKTKNQLIAGFCMLHENNRLKFSLHCVYSTGSLGELLLTAIPKQVTKDPIFWFPNQTKSVTFFLELNHEKLSIWYQIDQCHFVHTVENLVPYLKPCSLLT